MKPSPDLVLLDTNLLLLHLVDIADPSLLFTFKRVNQFTATDLPILSRVLASFRARATTPHVLAETSNFVDQAPLYRRGRLVRAFQNFADHSREVYDAAQTLCRRPEFERLGLTDTALSAWSDRAVILTTDFPLFGFISSIGGYCINFNQLRTAELLRP